MKFQLVAGDLCLDFVNTFDNRPVPERYEELLVTYADLADFVFQSGAIDSAQHSALVREAEAHPVKAAAVHSRAVELRETLYRILDCRLAGKRFQEADRQALSSAIGEAFSARQLQATRTGFRLGWPKEPSMLDAAWWPIASAAAHLLTSDDMSRVRTCSANTCRWMFVDRSKNHTRRWCDMKVCGNRTKVKRFYNRAKARI